MKFGDDSVEKDFHTSAIRQVECLDSKESHSESAVAQFVSLDEDGVIVFWITSEVILESESTLSLSLRRGSKVALIQTKRIDLTREVMRCLTKKLPDKGSKIFSGMKSFVHCMEDDPTAILFASGADVYRISRSGQFLQPFKFSSSRQNQIWVSEITSLGSFACDGINASLFLTGRSDGKVELYSLKNEIPIHSWSLSSFSSDASDDIRVLSIVPIRNSLSFYVVVAAGTIYEFDLLTNLYHPIRSTKVPLPLMGGRGHVAIAEFKRHESKMAIVSSSRDYIFTVGAMNQQNSAKSISDKDFNDFLQQFKPS